MLLKMFSVFRGAGGAGARRCGPRPLLRTARGSWPVMTVLVAALCALAGPPMVRAQDGVEYTVEFEGVPDAQLQELLRSVSDTYTYREQPPPSVSLLRNRARNDIPRLLEALSSWGYFKATVQVDVQPIEETSEVLFRVASGPHFLLEEVVIVGPEEEPKRRLPTPREIELRPGSPFRAQHILDGRERLLQLLGNAGHPYPRILETEVVADHDTNSVRVRFRVSPGPVAWFGETEIEGLVRVREDHAARLIPWDEGELFRQDLIEQARVELIRSGLFTLVEIRTGEVIAETNRLPMFLRLRERRHRTMRIGLNYTTDYGFGVLLGWEHRNLFGRGELFESIFTWNELRQALDTSFRKPHFLRDDQRLILRSTLLQEETDAYDSRSIRNTARVERDLTRRITVGAGVGLDYLDIEEDGARDTFVLLSLPLSLFINTTDDLLDPRRGFTISGVGTPFFEISGEDVNYFRYDTQGSVYFELLDARRLILASRIRYGQILGAERARIPATDRFYAGGGGSVRGYPFQSLSPLDENDDPIGGRSVIELSFELRSRFSERFGMVAFLDGGRAYAGETPDLGERLYWGAGLGLRYYTVIGPIRLDVAVPLQDRDGVDDSFQVYISIGQAF
jgi:translocation and assembly module TamA